MGDPTVSTAIAPAGGWRFRQTLRLLPLLALLGCAAQAAPVSCTLGRATLRLRHDIPVDFHVAGATVGSDGSAVAWDVTGLRLIHLVAGAAHVLALGDGSVDGVITARTHADGGITLVHLSPLSLQSFSSGTFGQRIAVGGDPIEGGIVAAVTTADSNQWLVVTMNGRRTALPSDRIRFYQLDEATATARLLASFHPDSTMHGNSVLAAMSGNDLVLQWKARPTRLHFFPVHGRTVDTLPRTVTLASATLFPDSARRAVALVPVASGFFLSVADLRTADVWTSGIQNVSGAVTTLAGASLLSGASVLAYGPAPSRLLMLHPGKTQALGEYDLSPCSQTLNRRGT